MEIASCLSHEDIPVKLRCAICNRLVLNAYRLPCCDQSICESCQCSLSEPCPVCAHSPLTADDCKPNKALRLTVKAFLKSEEKRRGKDGPHAASKPAQPASAGLNAAPAGSVSKTGGDSNSDLQIADQLRLPSSGGPNVEYGKEQRAPGNGCALDFALDARGTTPMQSASKLHNQSQPENSWEQSENVRKEAPVPGNPADTRNRMLGQGRQWLGPETIEQKQTNTLGFDQNQTYGGVSGFNNGLNGFGNVNWASSVGFHPMMQNGLAGASWASYPNMMTVLGAGADIIGAPNGMFGGYGGHGIVMNGMNGASVGMGYDGGYGMFGGQPAMRMGGIFGADTGYYPNDGYNQHQGQQGYNLMHHQPQFPNYHSQNHLLRHGFHSRSQLHSQGRGALGKDNRSQIHSQKQSAHSEHLATNEEAFHQQLPAGLSNQQSEQHVHLMAPETLLHDSAPDETMEREIQEAATVELAMENAIAVESSDPGPGPDPDPDPIVVEGYEHKNPAGTAASLVNLDTDREDITIQLADGATSSYPDDPRTHIQAFVRRSASTGSLMPPDGFREVVNPSKMQLPSSPTSTPTGPAAKSAATYQTGSSYDIARNSGNLESFTQGRFESRASYRGAVAADGAATLLGQGALPSSAPNPPGPVPPSERKGQGVIGAPTGPKAMREGLLKLSPGGRAGFPVGGRSRVPVSAASLLSSRHRSQSAEHRKSTSRTRARSQTPSRRHRHHRRHVSRTTSSTASEKNREPSRDRGTRRSYRSDDEDLPNIMQGVITKESSMESSSRRRNRTEKDRTCASYRSSDRSREYLRHRHISQSPRVESILEIKGANHTVSNAGFTERSRSNKLESRRHRNSSRKRNRPGTDATGNLQRDDSEGRSSRREHREETREFKIKDRSKRSSLEAFGDKLQREKAHNDPHTLEREARNQERLIKEQQRRESLNQERHKKRRRIAVESNDQAENGCKDLNGVEREGSRRKLRNGEDEGRMKKTRKISYKYEDEEITEARAALVEKEREGLRWA